MKYRLSTKPPTDEAYVKLVIDSDHDVVILVNGIAVAWLGTDGYLVFRHVDEDAKQQLLALGFQIKGNVLASKVA